MSQAAFNAKVQEFYMMRASHGFVDFADAVRYARNRHKMSGREGPALRSFCCPGVRHPTSGAPARILKNSSQITHPSPHSVRGFYGIRIG